MIYFIFVDKNRLLEEPIKKKYNFLWASLKTENRWQRSYTWLFIFRRLVLVYVAYFFVDFSGLQV